jgi:hypothetical protein
VAAEEGFLGNFEEWRSEDFGSWLEAIAVRPD